MQALASKQPGWGCLSGHTMPLMQNCASSGKLPKSPPYAQYSTVLPAHASLSQYKEEKGRGRGGGGKEGGVFGWVERSEGFQVGGEGKGGGWMGWIRGRVA